MIEGSMQKAEGSRQCETCGHWRGKAYWVDGEVQRSCVKLMMLTAATYAGVSGDGCGLYEPVD